MTRRGREYMLQVKFQSAPLREGRFYDAGSMIDESGFNPRPYVRGD